MQEIGLIFYIIVLLISVVIHEVAHGYMAYRFGDQTARLAGRLTLNPLKHIDPVGSIIVPALLAISQTGFVIGWAKPVPYRPENFSKERLGTGLVAAAGPLSNIVLAIVFSLLIRLSPVLGIASGPLLEITSLIVWTNIALAVFNLLPFPPLDGSKILFSLLPPRTEGLQRTFERYSLPILLVFIIVFSHYLVPVISAVFSAFTGLGI